MFAHRTGERIMLSVALLFSQDNSETASRLCSTINDAHKDWSATLYPIISEEDTKLWTVIKNGRLKVDIVMFIASEQFLRENRSYLLNLVQPSNIKYRFAWISTDRSLVFPKAQITPDIDLFVDSQNRPNCNNWDNVIQELVRYCDIVEIANRNNAKLKKEKTERKRKHTSLLLGCMIVYLAGLILAFALVINDSSIWFRSSAEMVIIFLLIFLAFFVLSTIYFWFTGVQKRREHAEKTQFGNDLDAALSKGSNKTNSTQVYSTVLDIVTDTAPLLNHELLDAIFSHLRTSHTASDGVCEETTNIVTTDQTPTIGDESYLPLGHLKVNWSEMKEYYRISKNQAKAAFKCAIAICILGILILAFAIASPFIPAISSHNVLIPIISTISGTIVELFAGTILLVYKHTLSQMNYYHQALADYQHYLSCINLASMVSDNEKRNQLYEQIISAEMNNISHVQSDT